MGINVAEVESVSFCFSVKMAEPSTQAHADRITNLPCEIAEIILNKLPTLDASRTSILSSPWRRRWLSNTRLVIDSNDMIAFLKDDEQMKLKKIGDLINYFLENHSERIETLGLKMHLEENAPTVFDWLYDLRIQGVEELILEQCGNTFFYICVTFLSSFFNLKSLSLTTVYLQFPKIIGKFKSLIELSLIKVYIKAKDMEFLSTVCVKLEKLTLLPTYQLVPLLHKDNNGMLLTIHGPSLKYFRTDFAYTEILIKNANHLSDVEIACPPFDRSWKGGIHWHEFIRGLSVFRSLRNLVVAGKFIEVVGRMSHCWWKVPLGNGHLVALYLHDVCLEHEKALTICLAIIAMLSNVENIDISVKKSRSSNCFRSFFERQAETGVCFRQLRSVKMRYIHQFGAALDFVVFVIARSPNIKTITIIKDGGGQYSEETIKRVCQQLKGCASDAEVEFIAKDALDMYNYFTATSSAPFYRPGRPASAI